MFRLLMLGRRQRSGGRQFLAISFLLLATCTRGGQEWPEIHGTSSRHSGETLEAHSTLTATPNSSASITLKQPPAQIDARLHVLHIQIPSSARKGIAKVWNNLREDALDSETVWRLHRNGLRVGLGRIERWEEIKAALDDLGDNWVHAPPPLRTLPGVPLALELDRTPQERRTIFFLDRDGIISGDTWVGSQRVLRVTYTLDTLDLNRVFLSVVPEIRQPLAPAMSYDRENGWATGPRRGGRAFATAAFAITLGPEEFVLLAPGEKADLFGIVGGAFLTDNMAGEMYSSYIFIRVEVKNVPQHN